MLKWLELLLVGPALLILCTTAALLGASDKPKSAASGGSQGADPNTAPGSARSRPASNLVHLTESGRAACSIVSVANGSSSSLIDHGVQSIVTTVKRWSAVDLPVVRQKPTDPIPNGPCVVLATLDALRVMAPGVIRPNSEIGKVEAGDEQGFAITSLGDRIFVTAMSPRGVYNGAVYLRDFLIDGPPEGLVLNGEARLRIPDMKGRVAYVMTIWGNEAEYAPADWNSVFQSFARDGIERIYFWASGHFPSQKFPQTYQWTDGEWDTTAKTRIGTISDLRAIIKQAHDFGMKLYLGGGLGAWCGTGNITNSKPGTMKVGPKIASRSLCPSQPESRAALVEYFAEMFDALPEADGVYIEMADEWGECLCGECSKPLDKFGSKQYGRAQLSLVQEIAGAIRGRHPHVRFAFTVGYDEHAHDPLFYDMVREMGDEHYEWMEARGRWDFAGPEGAEMPAAHFSRRVMKWKQWYKQPLELLVQEANRAVKSDFHGLITSFEPGYASGSFYTTIPFPTDLLPYALTGFAFREMTWEPSLSLDGLKERTRERFFGADAPIELADDLWKLREIIRQAPVTAPRRQGVKGTRKRALPEPQILELTRIAATVTAAWPSSGPKTREGLELMRRAIADTHRYFELPPQ